jgi:predicted glycoside hydrolase/deacetylase ChbG (UPF0249 family)
MVHAPAVREVVALARARPALSLGLHTDVGEWRYERGEWVAVYEHAPQHDAKALEAEVCGQLELFRRFADGEPTHLDLHQHAHRREPLKSLAVGLARQFGVPLRHCTPGVRYCGKFYGQDEMGKALRDRLTPTFLAGALERLQPGVTEMCCHPAATVDFGGAYSRERLEELQVSCVPIVRDAIERAGVALSSFVDICNLGAPSIEGS